MEGEDEKAELPSPGDGSGHPEPLWGERAPANRPHGGLWPSWPQGCPRERLLLGELRRRLREPGVSSEGRARDTGAMGRALTGDHWSTPPLTTGTWRRGLPLAQAHQPQSHAASASAGCREKAQPARGP